MCSNMPSSVTSASNALQPTIQSSITNPWSFAKWDLDVVRPLMVPAQKRFILAATDYFTKWVEAVTYANVKDVKIKNFLCIIFRYGIPKQ